MREAAWLSFRPESDLPAMETPGKTRLEKNALAVRLMRRSATRAMASPSQSAVPSWKKKEGDEVEARRFMLNWIITLLFYDNRKTSIWRWKFPCD